MYEYTLQNIQKEYIPRSTIGDLFKLIQLKKKSNLTIITTTVLKKQNKTIIFKTPIFMYSDQQKHHTQIPHSITLLPGLFFNIHTFFYEH